MDRNVAKGVFPLQLEISYNVLLLQVLLLIVTAVATQAELPRRAPYAASGWRPQVPFSLPNEFLPPVGSTVEISQARVQHAGTFSESLPSAQQLPPQTTPAAEYGPPGDNGFKIIYPEEDELTTTTTESQSNIKTGRYYVISPDNKLQRVVYRTSQTEGEDFTAQLKYSSVGELQDPVYKYNAQGQLQRVLK